MLLKLDKPQIRMHLTFDQIFAIVVSYNGKESTEATVKALIGKVGAVHIIDNASAQESLTIIKKLEREKDVSASYLNQNSGIGHALNTGVTIAKQRGYKWILTMDQDSIIDDFMISAYCKAHNDNSKIFCMSPNLNIYGKENKFNKGVSKDNVSPIKYAITSGNLINVEIFNNIGPYNEDLFIDCVDFDFSLRLRKFGYGIYIVKNAILKHSLGSEHNVPAAFAWFYTAHSPERRYYMYRNYFYIAHKYLFDFPWLIMKTTFVHFLLLLVIPFYDERPMVSLAHIGYGLRDYLNGKMGVINK